MASARTGGKVIPTYFWRRRHVEPIGSRTPSRSSTLEHGSALTRHLASVISGLLAKGDGYLEQMSDDIWKYRDLAGISDQVLVYNR